MSEPEPVIAAQTWAMALEFLQEAERASPDIMPRMATHAAYYAMFHAARTVLVQADGLAAPTRHSAVIGRFGQLAKQAYNSTLMAAGRMINGVRQERLLSDYNANRRPLATEAAKTVKDARAFVEICARQCGFPAP